MPASSSTSEITETARPAPPLPPPQPIQQEDDQDEDVYDGPLNSEQSPRRTVNKFTLCRFVSFCKNLVTVQQEL